MREKLREFRGDLTVLAICAAMAVASVLASGCRPPPPGEPTGSLVVRCASEAVQENWPRALPAVNSCLVRTDDWRACLAGLIDPAVGITADVIACVVRHSGAEYHAAAQANTNDARSARAAEHARMWLGEKGYVFQ